jgi:hypothetical protein
MAFESLMEEGKYIIKNNNLKSMISIKKPEYQIIIQMS